MELRFATALRALVFPCTLVLFAACGSPGAGPPPSPPTVAAIASQVSAIRSGAATPSGTAQAVATLMAPTLQVLQQTVGPIATSVAKSTVHITAVTITPDDSTIVVQNSGSSEVNLQDWTLLLGPNIPLTLPSITLAPGQTRTLHVASGTNTENDVFLAIPSVGAIATTFAPGQRAVLVTPDDQVASIFATS
jgi:hypothetical protein